MDQFYTKDAVAQECFMLLKQHVSIDTFDVILEPSAGKGAFYKVLPEDKRQGMDIEPKFEGVRTGDFLEFEPESGKHYLVIGNPPFGKVSSMAVKFFNRAAKFADVIAFIVPRTFKRVSVQNKLDTSFRLEHSHDLPLTPCCFEPSMTAKCCFQVWIKHTERRCIVKYNKNHPDFTFVKLGHLDENKQPTPPQGADFAIKAYGGGCGKVVREGLADLRPKSWHWVKANIDVDELIRRFALLDCSISRDTVRQDSLGRQELVYLYETKYNNKCDKVKECK